MRSSFGSRRKALTIRQRVDEEEDGPVDTSAEQSSGQASNDEEPVVKRPVLTPRGSVRSKKSTSLRLSFGPGGASGGNAGDESTEVFTPKKSALSRQALERSASQRSNARSIETPTLPIRGRNDDDRPSYSKEYLDELRSATPSAPRDPKDTGKNGDHMALDIASKFGAQADMALDSAIPTAAEIREKKERRARLAREQEYISVDGDEEIDGDDDDNYEIALRPRPKWGETRLVREDEDIAEGFDDFVEDGKISLGKKAEQRQKQQARMAMREMIEEADHDGDESDESEAERRAAYEAAQTRAGTYQSNPDERDRRGQHPERPTTPPIITPIPTLGECIERLEGTLREQEARRLEKVKQLEEIARRKIEVRNRQAEIQRLLDAAARNYESAAPNTAPLSTTPMLNNGL